MFPEVPDQHKPNKPMIPNGLGVFYVLISTTYLFLVYFFGLDPVKSLNVVSAPSATLTLAACILFGGFMGLLDDWIDVKWRYKAFLPLIAAIPLVVFSSFPELSLHVRTSITIPFIGIIEFGLWYYFLIIPLLVTIVTNTVNQLGGLNGLETIPPAIVLTSLMLISGEYSVLLYVPLIVWLLLSAFNFLGKIFIGNTGSFSIGITIAGFAIITDLKTNLVISILPYILNSSLILLTYFFHRVKASVSFDGKKLSSDHVRSLVTLATYHRSLTERQTVLLISLSVAATTIAAFFV